MSLSSKDINLILNFLNEDTCGSSLTFEQISAQFQHNISKSDYLRVGNALVLLLQNRDLIPSPQQRLIILFLFNDMYKNEQQSIHMNPFAPVFISILQNINGDNSSTQKHFHWFISPVTQHERWFVKALISNNKDIIKKTPNQVLQSGLPILNDDNGKGELKEKVQERLQQLPVLVQCNLPAVIDDPEINYVCLSRVLSIIELICSLEIKETHSSSLYFFCNPFVSCSIHRYDFFKVVYGIE
jgi:hypothetical protein